MELSKSVKKRACAGENFAMDTLHSGTASMLGGRVFGRVAPQAALQAGVVASAARSVSDAVLPGTNEGGTFSSLLRYGVSQAVGVSAAYGVAACTGRKLTLNEAMVVVLGGEILQGSAGLLGAICGGVAGGVDHYFEGVRSAK